MKYRLRVYGNLLFIILICLLYLLFFVTLNWYLSNDEINGWELQNIFQQNHRWRTWGICAIGFGIICGILSAVALFFQEEDKDFFLWFHKTIIVDTFDTEFFSNWRYIGAFIVIATLIFVFTSGDLYSGLRNSLELVGIVIWLIFIITTIIFMFTLIADILRYIFNKKWKRLC